LDLTAFGVADFTQAQESSEMTLGVAKWAFELGIQIEVHSISLRFKTLDAFVQAYVSF